MLKGIDTSHFSNITPQTLNVMIRNNTLYFNYIKTTDGVTFQDPAFVHNWNMSRDAGLVCGAYHFLRPLTDPAQQANNFISQYRNVSRAGVLPPVVDIEWTQTKTNATEQWDQLPPPQRVNQIRTFIDAIESELNVSPIIYTATNFWQSFIANNSSADDTNYFNSHLLWIADPNNRGTVPTPWQGETPAFTQTHFGETGSSTDPYDLTDQDSFNGTTKDFLNTAVAGFTLMNGFPFSYIVRDIQNVLITSNFLQGNADGYFGDKTEQAVKAFQTASSLFANGVIDAQTWNKLL